VKSEQTTPPARPPIQEYRDYRAYLRAQIRYLKATRPTFSYRNFSRRAGFSSPNFLKQVAEGQRNLSEASIPKFARGLGLDDHEHEVFEALVGLDQAKSDEARRRHYRRLRRLTAREEVGRLEADQYDAYSRWHTLVVRELVGLGDGATDVASLARRVFPRVRPPQVRRALALLERLRLLVRDDDGHLRLSLPKLRTQPMVQSLAVRNFHRAMLDLAARALDSLPTAERNVTSLTIPLDAAKYQRACELIAELRAELLDLSEEGSKAEGHEVFQAVFSLFPVTRRSRR